MKLVTGENTIKFGNPNVNIAYANNTNWTKIKEIKGDNKIKVTFPSTNDRMTSLSAMTDLTYMNSSFQFLNTNQSSLKKLDIAIPNITSLSGIFNSRGLCTLTSCTFTDATAVTNANVAFNANSQLVSFSGAGFDALSSITSMFSTCPKLTTISFSSPKALSDMSDLAYNDSSLQYATLPSFATNSQRAFYNCTSLISVYDTNSTRHMLGVQNADSMFYNCTKLTNVPNGSTYGYANLTNASSMFYSCKSLTSITIYNASGLTSASSMFMRCEGLKSVKFNHTINQDCSLTSMFGMCTSLTTVSMDIPKVRSIRSLCSIPSITSVTLGTISSVTDATIAFQGSGIKTFYTASLSSCTSADSMFEQCKSLTSVTLADCRSLVSATKMFAGCSAVQAINLGIVSSVTDATAMFSGCSSLASKPSPYVWENVLTATSMYADCIVLPEAIGNMTKVKTAESMFRNCQALTRFASQMPVNTNANQMFQNCTSLTYYDGLSSMAELTTAWGMLSGCTALVTMNNQFSLPKLTDATYMFYNCSALSGANIFFTSTGVTMMKAFYNCSNWTGFIIGDWDSSQAANTKLNGSMEGAFYNCQKMTQIYGFDANNCSDFKDAFYKCYKLTVLAIKNVGVDLDLRDCSVLSSSYLKWIGDRAKTASKTLTLNTALNTSTYTNAINSFKNKGWTVTFASAR